MREKLQALKPWLWPLLTLVLAVIAGSIIVGKMSREVWTYYTDGKGLKTGVRDEKARPVLWQDPEPQYFEEKDRQAPGASLEAAFSADGTTMVLVRRGQSADLYLSDWDGRKWSAPRPIDAVNSDANERSPALSSDGRSLYFASDRKEGAGGYDLYVAELENGKWKPPQALPKEINTKANELGPALSADGMQLYFSSDRGGRGDDIFVAKVTDGKFGAAEPVDGLNSKASDVRAALTARGDHVFLASDRDRDSKSGFKVYISRVVDGRAQPPEEVDLHIDRGNVLDPAVRMDGFDLLFSVGETEQSGYLLYRSTTREVVGYTDLTRWEDFKSLLHNISWWLLLALAALMALIYILEKWRDMTTLFHKCLAGSAVLHLIALLIAMVWLIAQKVEDQELEAAEVSINVDALAEEELAMESVPEETQMTDASTHLESEKVQAEFGAPGFQEQKETQPVLEAARTVNQADVVEVRLANSESPQEPVPQPAMASESSLLSDLDAIKLPSVDEPLLEEAQQTKPVEAADASKDAFEPEAIAATSTAKSETAGIADAAVKTEADATRVTEVNEPLPPADAPKESSVEVSVAEAPTKSPDEPPPLESKMLSDLEVAQPVNPAEVALDEGSPATAVASADTAADEFKPDALATGLTSGQARGEVAADSAKHDAAEAGAVATGEAPNASVLEATAAEAPTEPAAGQTPLESKMLSDLDVAQPVNPAEVSLDEGSSAAAAARADTAADAFRPDASVAGLTRKQARGQTASDSATQAAADADAVATGNAGEQISALETIAANVREPAASEGAMPTAALEPGSLSGLPEIVPVDPGTPMLEEGAQTAGLVTADPSKDQFTPGNAVPNLATAPAGHRPLAATAPADKGGAESIAQASSEGISASIPTPGQLEASGSLPNPGADGVAPELPVSRPVAVLLPDRLEVDREGDPKALAAALQKQRGKPRIDAIKQMGGSDGTEKSINSALEWLTANQDPAGHWDSKKHGATMNYNNGAVGLGLLCFYGWGERHDQACKYQDNVRRALDWLLTKQRKDGYLGEGPGMMYSHAIATIALCEGYGLTKDQRLREPSERAIAYTVAAQSKRRGGWRYSPGEDSDTSVTGWQYMALHSARMAGLEVPQDSFDRARGFLDQMGGGKHGGLYGYQERGKLSRAMVATGMFCRQLDLVPPTHPMMQESARLLKMYPMEAKDPDLYYVYYATLALYQHQGPIWEQWNERMKEILPQIQTKDGSWNPSSSMTKAGGRVISTALSTLSLEVYYRLLPMYGFRNEEEPAPEPKKRGN